MTISIHAPRAGSDVSLRRPRPLIGISIHAPRAGSDLSPISPAPPPRYFNPRSPCGERRPSNIDRTISVLFQSTLPVRGATGLSAQIAGQFLFQSTLPVRGATGFPSCRGFCVLNFNPRSPCGERLRWFASAIWPIIFQSTLPVRGATGHLCHNALPELISIHAPRAGSDGSGKDGGEDGTDFNPRSPCGERRAVPRGAGADLCDFNPRSPCGERPVPDSMGGMTHIISIHAPRAGSDI